MSIVDCFGDIVGLTQSHDSSSGLYITDLEALSTIEGLEIEAGKDVEEILADARRTAILKLNSDLTSLMSKYATIRRPFRGKIGSSRWQGKRTGGGELLVICNPLRNGLIQVNNIGLLMAEAGVVQVTISSNIPDFVNIVLNLNAHTERVCPNTVAISLAMQHDSVDYVEYTFSHSGDFMESKLSCSSCKRWSFDYHKPRFAYHGAGAYINAAGKNNSSYINSSRGFVIGMDISCDVSTIICDGEFDFDTNPMAQSYAQAIQYKAGSVVAWNILRNQNLNRILMQNQEDLRDAARYYERKYNDIVTFINKTRDYTHDCVCNNKGGWISRPR